ncbi:hypothetical protein [uncultured Methanobrevibacter sp.]|uniref:NrdR family transcriptional regulator n=1 Tax=uncultured Methanobrevibacter sp. TaxID=253161 RepID=UPI0026211DDE|nr:hypothetical protein [uncultured Methanobrevibacter sp.]
MTKNKTEQPAETMQAVLQCSRCGSENVCIWDSRKLHGSQIRRRKCKDCNMRWTTIEVDYYQWLHEIESR